MKLGRVDNLYVFIESSRPLLKAVYSCNNVGSNAITPTPTPVITGYMMLAPNLYVIAMPLASNDSPALSTCS